MRYFQSIRTQLLFAITITLLVFLLVAMGGLYVFQKDALTSESIKKVTEIGSVLKTGLKGQMITQNTELTQTLIDEIKTYKNITDAFIINADQVVKFSSDPGRIGKTVSKESGQCRQCHHDATGRNTLTLPTRNAQGVSVLRNVTPIYNEAACLKCHSANKKILGLLFVDYSTQDTDALISATLWRLLVTAAAAFIIISFIIFYITSRLIYKPIALLIDGTDEIKRGNYKKQICYEGSTEFKTLADSFNDMSKNIVQQISDIKNKSFELSVLYAIVKKISETMYLDELKVVVVDLLFEMLNCDQCIVITPTMAKNTFELIIKEKGAPPVKSTIEYQDNETVPELQERRISDPFKRWVAQDLTTPELSDNSLFAHIPLVIRDVQLGIVIAVRNANNPFDDDSFHLLNVIKEHLAVAFENARLYTMAITDELTRLFTVRHFQIQMEIQMSRYVRYGQKYSVLMMDIDKFKSVNDTYGHPAGDVVLREVALVIKDSLRDLDVPCRYGGEEFAVILPETTEKALLLVAERIRNNVEKKIIDLGEGLTISITISIGCASCPQNGIATMDIMAAADKALYRAKETGRNKVVLG